MTEKEKMVAGKPYYANDPQLMEDRIKAKALCKGINDMDPSLNHERKPLYKELFQIDTDCYIEPNFYCDYGYNIDIGKSFYANHNCVILDGNKVTIGDYVMFGPNVQVYTATHPLNVEKRIAGEEMAYPIDIGDHVWIGGGSIILPGVKIGKNTVIGAGSVVTKDIPSDVLAVGNPCKVIKKL